MIELPFKDFHDQNFEVGDYSLYVMKNGLGDVLYVGISDVDVWGRWFAWGGHMTWDGGVIFGESSIGEKIENHLPESLNWKIQLWTLKDCLEYCDMELPDPNHPLTDLEYQDALHNVETRMIKKLSPALNRQKNLNPGRDTTPKSQKELDFEKKVNAAYDEIFNKRK